MGNNQTESHQRSVIKGITWRVTATILTIIMVYIFTRDIKISLGIGVVEVVTKFIFYYFHERVWNRICWGRKV